MGSAEEQLLNTQLLLKLNDAIVIIIIIVVDVCLTTYCYSFVQQQ